MLFSKNVTGPTRYSHRQKKNLDPAYLILHTKINSKWTVDLNGKGEKAKILADNTE